MTPSALDQLIFDPLVPIPLIVLLGLVLGGLTFWVYRITGARLSLGKQITLLVLRFGALALALLILLQPSKIESLPSPIRDKVTLVAVDTSRSMRQADAGKLTRFAAARELLWNAGLASREGLPAPDDVRLFRFAENASPLTQALTELKADGLSTRFHPSIQTMLGSLTAEEGAHALFLLTDGHDFELVPPAKTALAARNRQVPIYAVVFGAEGNVRDLSVRMSSYQPFYYAKQTVRINALLRPLGCPYETLEVALLREGQVVQHRSVVIKDEVQVPLLFEVTEPKSGQFEYEIRVSPLPGEIDAANNSAVTYLNVIDKKIRVLALEGQPYWDSTFLQRSLRRNDKLDLDSVVYYARDRLRVIRTDQRLKPFEMPGTPAAWNQYDLVILGKGIDEMLKPPQIEALTQYVDQLGGVVVFSRGEAFSGKAGAALQPVTWGKSLSQRSSLKVGREGQGIAPFKLLSAAAAQNGVLPELLGSYEAGERKPLSATLAELDSGSAFPAMVHRRFGAGQVLSVGVDGLWRWAFNAKTEGTNTVFDRFWDQTTLWLMGGRDFMPGTAFTFRADTANVLLGEKIRFRVVQREPDPKLGRVPFSVRREGQELARLACAASSAGEGPRLTAEFLPEQTGRYVAESQLPDGTKQTVRFIVYRDDVEETEVAADLPYLRRLCEGSGGHVLRPEEFAAALRSVKVAPVDGAPQSRKVTLWDRTEFFWLIGLLFGADWYLRRRWGLS